MSTTDEQAWVNIMKANEMSLGDVVTVQISGRDYAIYSAPDTIYASLGYCTHGGALLCDGYFDGHTIECPLHQGCFDIRTGKATGKPATTALKTFPARIRNGWIQLKLS